MKERISKYLKRYLLVRKTLLEYLQRYQRIKKKVDAPKLAHFLYEGKEKIMIKFRNFKEKVQKGVTFTQRGKDIVSPPGIGILGEVFIAEKCFLTSDFKKLFKEIPENSGELIVVPSDEFWVIRKEEPYLSFRIKKQKKKEAIKIIENEMRAWESIKPYDLRLIKLLKKNPDLTDKVLLLHVIWQKTSQ